jgi:hypothetical protein
MVKAGCRSAGRRVTSGARIDTRCGRRAALAALASYAAAAAGCTSAPVFPPAEQPLVGTVLIEQEVVVGSSGTNVNLAGTYFSIATLYIPPGAVPAGTRLLVRLLRDVHKELPGATPEDFWSYTVQILPATVTFATPATLTTPSILRAARVGGVLFAREDDTAWQRRGEPTASGDRSSLSVSIDGPHLWSLEGATVFEPIGTFVRTELWCGNATVRAPADTIEFSGGGDYLWMRNVVGATCTFAETGRVAIAALNGVAAFTPAGGPARSYYLDLSGNGFNLAFYEWPSPECGGQDSSSQSFRRPAAGADGGVPTSDGGCTTDAAPRTDAVAD